jgi:hypothetical protein
LEKETHQARVVETAQQGDIKTDHPIWTWRIFLGPSHMPSAKDEQRHEWIWMTCKKNWPVSFVEDEDHRMVMKHSHTNFSSKQMHAALGLA